MTQCVPTAAPPGRLFPRGRVLRTAVACALVLASAACAGRRAPDPFEPGPEPEPELVPVQEAPVELIESARELVESAPEPVDFEIPAHLGEVLEKDDIRTEFTHMFATESAVEVPEALYQAVLRYVDFFYRGRARSGFGEWLAREGKYGELIRSELRQAGLPEDLVYLAMIESGFSNIAVSRAKAVGMWQFMAPTGREVGLRIDQWVDERRDPVRATRAAIRHLRWLHEQTGSWALVAAAYNAGLGRVTRTQKAAGETDYFRLVAAGRLPEETRNYVPAILAASLIAHHRERFGFTDVIPQEPFAFDSVEVDAFTRLSAVAEAAGTVERAIRELNPHLIKGVAPPGAAYPVRVPVGTAPDEFARSLAGIPPARRFLPREVWATVAYTVRPGDSWWKIARQNRTTVKELRQRNPGIPETLQPGMRIKLQKLQKVYTEGVAAEAVAGAATRPGAAPAEKGTKGDAAEPSTPAAEPGPAARPEPAAKSAPPAHDAPASAPAGKAEIHVVQRGETMTGLAGRYGLTLEQLARWNGMQEPRAVRIGEKLRLTPPDPVVHTVAPGETMTGLARRYGVSTGDLVKWNRLPEPRDLRIGEKLVVTEPEGR